jgi:hypothetical protein
MRRRRDEGTFQTASPTRGMVGEAVCVYAHDAQQTSAGCAGRLSLALSPAYLQASD